MRSSPALKRALALLCSLAAAACVAAAQGVPDGWRQQLVVPLPGAGFVGFRLETTLDATPQGQPLSLSEVRAALLPQALLGEQNTIHRVLLDRAGDPVFAYDLVVVPAAQTRKFTVTARPVDAEFERQLVRARGGGSSQARAAVPTLQRAAGPQTLDDGDSVSLDLLVNPKTGVRVADVFKVSFDRARLWQSPPRDFTADSARLAIRDHSLLVDGKLVAGGRAARGVAGSLVWFYAPGRGRFVLSLVPRDGYDFRKIALIEDNKISFEFGGVRYEWVSGAPVVGGGGSWHAWVLHDPDYTPEIGSPEERARGIAKREEDEEGRDESVLKQVLSGRAPRAPAQPGFDTKKPNGGQERARPERVRIGAADGMENLLPKK